MSDDRLLDDPEAAPGNRLVDLTVPEFRTVSTRSGRTGVRLERAFWRALDYLSALAGEKRSRYAAGLIDAANALDINATSAIRSSAVDLLLTELEGLKQVASPGRLISLLQVSPSPAFALDRSRRLVQSNPEFVRYLRSAHGGQPLGTVTDGAQLSIDRPLDRLFDELPPGEHIECGISIRVGNRERRTTARILMVPPAPSRLLVGYILS